MPTQERRSILRRQSDRELLARYQALLAANDPEQSRELRHRRRRAIRHHCHVHIALKIQHSSGMSDLWTVEECKIKGRILDLSTDGSSLFTAHSMDIGQELNLIVELQNGKRFQASGVVRWTKRVAEREGFASGVQFTQIKETDQRLIQLFLDELDRTIGL